MSASTCTSRNPDQASTAIVTVRIPLTVRKRGGRKMVIAPDGSDGMPQHRPRIDSTLIKAIARAYCWQRLLEEGTYATLRELAASERIAPSYVSRLLRLTLYPPAIIEAALDGTLPQEAAAKLAGREPSQLWSKEFD